MRWRDGDDRSRESRRRWLAAAAGWALGGATANAWRRSAALAQSPERTSALVSAAASAAATAAAIPLIDWPCRVLTPTPKGDERRVPVVTALDARNDELLFASAGDDHCIYLWDAQEGCVLHRFEGHDDWIHTLAFSPDGRWLASSGRDRRVMIWDVERRELVGGVDDPRRVVTQIAWSHDGTWLASVGYGGCLRTYDVATRRLIRELPCPDADMRALAIAPDDRTIAAAGRNGVLRFWSWPEGLTTLDLRPHRRRVRTIEFSPDGRYLTSAGEDRWMHVHDMQGDEVGYELPTRAAKVLSSTFLSPRHLATGGSDNRIRIWDLKMLREVGELRGHLGSVAAMAATPQHLLTGGFDTTIRIWRIQPLGGDDRVSATLDGTRR